LRTDPDAVPQPPSAARRAKPAKAYYRRNLPHVQVTGRALFVTFSTWRGFVLPDEARRVVLRHCLHDNGAKFYLHVAVVMPDHVHLLFTPMRDSEGEDFGLAEIMGGIKGASAHSLNKLLGRSGRLWNVESYDHVVRLDEGIRQTAEYICRNPVRTGLAASEDEYPWLWREWVDGTQR
jgi:REP-associated tyrosine transposase